MAPPSRENWLILSNGIKGSCNYICQKYKIYVTLVDQTELESNLAQKLQSPWVDAEAEAS